MTEEEFRKAHDDDAHRAWVKANTREGLPPAVATCAVDLGDETYFGACRVCAIEVTLVR